MSKIHLDIDGVLADFDAGVRAKGYEYPSLYFHRPKETWTEDEHKSDKIVQGFMSEPGFFLGLPVMSGAGTLWSIAQSHGPMTVLTARPKGDLGGKRVAIEKAEWINKHLGLREEDQFICCLRSEKANYAKGNILIDDLPFNIEQWALAGGTGILFRSMSQAVEDLKKVLDVRS